jgi:hypothetical protein
MSEIGISYEAGTQPNPIGFDVVIGLSGTDVKATISNVQPFIAVLKPTGNVAEVIMSGAAWPLAQTMGVAVPPLATQLVRQLPPITVTSISPFTQTVEGETLTITPRNLKVGEWNGMMMVSGDIAVT